MGAAAVGLCLAFGPAWAAAFPGAAVAGNAAAALSLRGTRGPRPGVLVCGLAAPPGSVWKSPKPCVVGGGVFRLPPTHPVFPGGANFQVKVSVGAEVTEEIFHDFCLHDGAGPLPGLPLQPWPPSIGMLRVAPVLLCLHIILGGHGTKYSECRILKAVIMLIITSRQYQ